MKTPRVAAILQEFGCEGLNPPEPFQPHRGIIGVVNTNLPDEAECPAPRAKTARRPRSAVWSNCTPSRCGGGARALCRDDQEAEDLAQETLVEAWRSLRRFDGRCRFSTWLYGILRHRFLKAHRKRRPAAGGDETAVERPSREAPPPAAAEQAEDARLVQAAPAALPDEHRAVLELRFFAGAVRGGDRHAARLPARHGQVAAASWPGKTAPRENGREPFRRCRGIIPVRNVSLTMYDPLPNCEPWHEPISLLAAGCLPAEEEPGVRQHLADCPACAARLDELTTVCAGLSHSRPSAAVPTAVLCDRWHEAADFVTPRRPLRGRSSRVLWLSGALAASLLVAVLWLANHRPAGPPSRSHEPRISGGRTSFRGRPEAGTDAASAPPPAVAVGEPAGRTCLVTAHVAGLQAGPRTVRRSLRRPVATARRIHRVRTVPSAVFVEGRLPMKRRFRLVLAGWSPAQAVSPTPLLAADPPAGATAAQPNAAVIYWQAFAAMPTGSRASRKRNTKPRSRRRPNPWPTT